MKASSIILLILVALVLLAFICMWAFPINGNIYDTDGVIERDTTFFNSDLIQDGN